MRTTRNVLLFAFAFLFLAASLIANAQMALQFVPVTPCRLVDTRPDRGGSGPIQGGTFQDFPIQQEGGCNIPATAAAYSLNIAVVPEGYLGYLTLWPAGLPQPVVATLNSVDGRIKANAAIVGAGTGGAVSVYVTNTTNIVLDIDGYFEPAVDSALAFYPLTPCRVADTRPDHGGGGPILGGTTQDFPILDATSCNIPSTAQAYSLNFAAVPPGPLGYLTVWPTGGSKPLVSTLNDLTGTIVANAAIVGAGTGGEVSVYPSNDTNLVIDINGYFASPGPGGLALYAVTPCRVIDTRTIGTGEPFSGTLSPPVDVEHSPCAPSDQAQAYVLNASVVPDGALGYLTLWQDGVPQPLASTLNALDGYLTNNMAIVPTTNGEIDAYASGTTQLILDISAYFAPLPPLSVTTTSLPAGTINVPYSSTLSASGGEPPYSWTVTGGALPPGLGLSTAGVISGTPTAGGVYNFTVQVTDTLTNMASAPLSITIQTGPLVITTMSLPTGTVNVPYDAMLGASGGTPPYTWSLVQGMGTLPIGLSLDPGTGLIMGTPTVAGTSNFTVQVMDSSSPQMMAMAPLSITINASTNNGALQGVYAFSFSGYNSGSPVVMAGSFIADGNGNITSGVLDMNSASGGPQLQVALTGTYSIQANGLGTMTFVTTPGTFVFAVAVSNKGISGTSRNGNLIQRDPANPGSYGSGVILVQNSLQFNLPALKGIYALGYFGIDSAGKRLAGAGAYNMDKAGNLTNGAGDVDDNGVPASTTFTGTFGAPDANTGRATATLTTNGIVTNYVFYVISSAQIVMVSTDPIGAPASLTLWSIAQQHPPPQTGFFTDLSLAGTSVIEVTGTDVMGGNPVAEAEAGVLTTDGQGNGSFSIDQNDGGTLNQSSGSGTYTVAANGRVTLSSSFGSNTPVFYLVSQNQAFVVGTDSLVTSGILDAQSSPPFSNSSILGTYLGGTVAPALSSLTNAVSWASADGNLMMGNINLALTTSGPSGPGSSQLQGTYQVDGTGRGVLTLNGSPAGIVYVVSPQKFVVLPNTTGPILSTFVRGTTN
jgi:Putative Ig domain